MSDQPCRFDSVSGVAACTTHGVTLEHIGTSWRCPTVQILIPFCVAFGSYHEAAPSVPLPDEPTQEWWQKRCAWYQEQLATAQAIHERDVEASRELVLQLEAAYSQADIDELKEQLASAQQERDEAQEGAQFYLKRATDAKILQRAAEDQSSALTSRLQQVEAALTWVESYYGHALVAEGCPCDPEDNYKCPLHAALASPAPPTGAEP